MTILDVRSKSEFDRGHVPGATHVPFWAVLARASEAIPSRAEPVTVYCGHGPRAWIAKALLRAAGFRQVCLLPGHMRRWNREGRPLE